jgi:uncharacterized protein (TIGR03435 family)
MRRILAITGLSVVTGVAVCAQTPAFEVATVKPAARPEGGMIRMGMGGDPGRINYLFVTLKDVLARAYRLKPYQIGGPSWIESERYDITAKIPEGAADQVPEMLQVLLSERFHMQTHRETRELPIYALTVGKGGAKLTPAAEVDPGPQIFSGADGAKMQAQKMTAERGTMVASDGGGGGTAKMRMNRATMSSFADMLSRMLDRPVVDLTGVDGKYDIVLEVPMEDMIGMKKMAAGMGMMHGGPESGPAPDSAPTGSIFSAVTQLGLKLDSRKSQTDFLVIDKAEKVATEN